MGRKIVRRGVGKRSVGVKDFLLADEIRYIQRRAAKYDARLVRVNSIALFSTETGDAWLLDPEDHLAAPLARGGDPQDVSFSETDTQFWIDWNGEYRIDGEAFVYFDRKTRRTVTMLGYPTRRLSELEKIA